MAILAIQEHRMDYLKVFKRFGVPKKSLIRLCKQKDKPIQKVTNLKLGRLFLLEMEAAGFYFTRCDIIGKLNLT